MDSLMNHQYTQIFTTLCNNAYNKASQVYNEVQKEGEAQNKTLAFLRSGVGLYSVTQDPVAAFAGAAFASWKPNFAETVCRLADGGITGAWNNSSFKGRVVVVSAGVGLYWIGVPYIGMLGTVFATKVGMEHTLKLLGNEKKASLARELDK